MIALFGMVTLLLFGPLIIMKVIDRLTESLAARSARLDKLPE